MINALERIAAAKASRTKAGLVSVCGLACPTQAWVDYYNARAAEPRDDLGRIVKTPRLNALKAAACASTS